MFIYIYMYIYICLYICIYIYMSLYIYIYAVKTTGFHIMFNGSFVGDTLILGVFSASPWIESGRCDAAKSSWPGPGFWLKRGD